MTATRDHRDVLADWTAFWNGAETGARHTRVLEPACRQTFDHARPNLDEVADLTAAHLRREAAEERGGLLPTVYCDFGTISTARLYGGDVIPPPEGGMVHIAPRVTYPDELADLRACAFEESDFQLALDLYHKVCDRMGTGDIYLRTPDFQGPLNTLALVMDQQEMLMAMMTELIGNCFSLRRRIGASRGVKCQQSFPLAQPLQLALEYFFYST